MPDFTEYQQLLLKRAAEKQKEQAARRAEIIPRVLEVAHKAQTVVGHPGWQFYLDSIETRVQEIEQKRQSKTHAMIFGTALGHELELLKIELNVMDAEIAGLRFAQSLIPQAIAEGQRIVADSGVNGQAAAVQHRGLNART